MLIDTELKGFLLRLTSSPSLIPELSTRGETSDIALFSRFKSVNFVNSTKDDISDIALKRRFSDVRLFNSVRAEISDIWSFSERVRCIRLLKLAKADMSHAESCCPSRSDFKFVRPTNGEMSDIGLLQICSSVRLVNPIRGEMSDIGL